MSPIQSTVAFGVLLSLWLLQSLSAQPATNFPPVQGAAPNSISEIEGLFHRPPDDSRMMVRWWWFGPSIRREEIAAEMRHMKAGGIGGFELQTVYPLAVDDPARGIRNVRYLSPEFLDLIRFTSQEARKLGLRMDLTIGSGWPYGGPYISAELAAMRLRSVAREITPGIATVMKPVPYEGERLIAAFVARGSLTETDADSFHELDLAGSSIPLPNDTGPRILVFYFAAPTGQAVKRAAFAAEGPVLDHYNQAAIEKHLHETGDKLLGAAEPGSVYSVFCDSLEVFEADWTAALLEEFHHRRGYDLKPLLPILQFEAGERSENLRRDFGHTLSELYEERFLIPMRQWADRNKVQFRMQNYGLPPATLASYRHVGLPEGEGWPWTNLTGTRWAASAAHLFGKPVVSSETWTWIHSPAFRATPLDIKAEADQHFLMGVNQLIGHGWPYSPPQAGTPGWSFYAAGVLNDKNPWWPVMPDLALYLQRVSFLLRQGKPVADIAIYTPTEDAYAKFKPGSPTYLNLFETTVELIGPKIIPAILSAGLDFDLIDDGTLVEAQRAGYKTIVLPNVRHMPEGTRRWMIDRASDGTKVLAVGRKPEGDWLSASVVEASDLRRHLLENQAADVALTPTTTDIGFVHRQIDDADIYFLANTGNTSHNVRARFRSRFLNPELWDANTGKIEKFRLIDGSIALDFEPYSSRILIFRDKQGHAARATENSTYVQRTDDISSDWRVQIGNTLREHVNLPFSWSEEAATRYFSGTATFSRTVDIRRGNLVPGSRLSLDFGDAAAAERESLSADSLRGYSFAALLTTPIRDAATVFINGKRAGSLWAPPYTIDITNLVVEGTNTVSVEVYNTAINTLAEGGKLADTNALVEQYGLRFRFQDMDHLKPLVSGILSNVKLTTKTQHK